MPWRTHIKRKSNFSKLILGARASRPQEAPLVQQVFADETSAIPAGDCYAKETAMAMEFFDPVGEVEIATIKETRVLENISRQTSGRHLQSACVFACVLEVHGRRERG